MNKFTPKTDFATAKKRAEALCSRMSLKEKADFVQGYAQFFIRSFPHHGIPLIYMSDASQGIHLRPDLDSRLFRQPEKTVAYPCFLSLAASWNPELAHEYAQAIGEECRAAGIHVLLGPALNLYRISQNGRNFEYLGEDPYLVSRLIEAYVPGLQNTGTMATIKHFICNNSDFFRRRSNSIVSERAVHELYLPGFKAGVDAGAMAVMTSYNQLNGQWCGQSSSVINTLLRGELGFKWLVMSDWTSIWDTAKMISSGQDLDMPGPSVDDIESLVTGGKADEKDLDRMVTDIITACIAMGFYDRAQTDPSLSGREAEHEAIALKTAREGIVLLKNNGILPLKKNRRILVVGDYLDRLPRGGGSAWVDGYDTVLLGDALMAEFSPSITLRTFPGDDEIRAADIVLLSAGTDDSEGWDRSFSLPEEKDAWIEKVCRLNANVIVIVNSGSGIRMTRWNEHAAAVIYAWYPGQNGNTALAEILSGRTNPSGKLPMTIERDFSDSPGFGYIPEGEELYHDWPKDEMSHPVFDICYDEDVFAGYRWYEHKGITPLYPFGHGLSYSHFTYENITTDREKYSPGDEVVVTFTLRNTSTADGYETAQIYIHDHNASVPRPPKELKGFTKVFLPAGAHAEVKMRLGSEAFSFWHPEMRQWTCEEGVFSILAGSSSADIRLKTEIDISG